MALVRWNGLLYCRWRDGKNSILVVIIWNLKENQRNTETMLFYFLRFCLSLRKVITCLVLVDLEIALVDLGELKERKRKYLHSFLKVYYI